MYILHVALLCENRGNCSDTLRLCLINFRQWKPFAHMQIYYYAI